MLKMGAEGAKVYLEGLVDSLKSTRDFLTQDTWQVKTWTETSGY